MAGFDALRKMARAEGHTMLDRLAEQWRDGSNRFDRCGECYLGLHVNGALAAVGGIGRDGYAGGEGLGRVRHLFVRPDLRQMGHGSALLRHLIESARPAFPALRLRTGNSAAAAFYERHGFFGVDEPCATHRITLAQHRF